MLRDHVFKKGRPSFPRSNPVWQCIKCREQIEEPFEVCWNCGTSRDGVEDPDFRKADDASEPPEDFDPAVDTPYVPGKAPAPASPVQRECPHCGSFDRIRAITLGQSTEAGNVGLRYRALMIMVFTEALLADVCKACGTVTRFYVRETDRDWIGG